MKLLSDSWPSPPLKLLLHRVQITEHRQSSSSLKVKDSLLRIELQSQLNLMKTKEFVWV
jgi:hypothetical protein